MSLKLIGFLESDNNLIIIVNKINLLNNQHDKNVMVGLIQETAKSIYSVEMTVPIIKRLNEGKKQGRMMALLCRMEMLSNKSKECD